MTSQHLIFKFYLWFLFTMTMTVATTGLVIHLVSPISIKMETEEWITSKVGLGRDFLQNLLQSGISFPELEQSLNPLVEEGKISIIITSGDGREVFLHLDPDGKPLERILPTREELRETLREGSSISLHKEDRSSLGLPILLPSGKTGVIFFTHSKGHWENNGSPFRFFFGLGVILVVIWIMCWPLAGYLSRPLRKMAETAEAIGRGDLSARIKLKRKDEIGKLANSFNLMAENLEKLIVGHKQLLADISHELRSPLARLEVALELASREGGKKAQPYLITAGQQTEVMEEMIEELLFFSRLDASPYHYQLNLESIALPEFLAELGGSFQKELQKGQVKFHIAPPKISPEIQADRKLLTRALGNVIQNGISHSSQSSTISIGISRGDDRVLISIADEGPGVPEEMLEKIFEPFFRTDSARSRATGGVGLGLAIAKRCMEAQGGGIFARPGAEGKGLAITLWLPLASEKAE